MEKHMRALVLIVSLIFSGTAYGSEPFLSPPTKNEQAVSNVVFTGFVAAAAATIMVGLMTISKARSEPNAQPHFLATSIMCDGAYAAILAASLLTIRF